MATEPAVVTQPSRYYQNINDTSKYMDAHATMGVGNYTMQDLGNQGWVPVSEQLYLQGRGNTPAPAAPVNQAAPTQPNAPTNPTTPPAGSVAPPGTTNPAGPGKDWTGMPLINNGNPTSTTPTTPTTPADLTKNIKTQLSLGLDSSDAIATALGIDKSQVDTILGGDYQLKYLMDENKQMNMLDAGYQDYKKQMADIQNGNFQLTAGEQAQLQATQEIFDRLRAEQLTANKNFEGATMTEEIRSGRQEFMSQISSGIYKQAVDSGIQKIKDLDLQATMKLSELRDLFQEKRYKQVAQAYDQLNNYLTQKNNAIKDIYTATKDLYDEVTRKQAAAAEAARKELETKKLKLEIGKSTLDQLGPTLKNADEATIKQIADYYGIDQNMVKGAQATMQEKAKAEITKQDQTYLTKGYETIAPADITRMKDAGYDVISVGGRAYAKPPKLTSKTYKGVTSWYNELGQQVDPNKLAAAVKRTPTTTSSPTPTKSTPKSSTPATPTGKYLPVAKNQKQYYAVEQELKKPIISGPKPGDPGSLLGKDRKMSPVDYNAGKDYWVSQGLDPAEYDKRFKSYKDPKNAYYK